MRELYEKQMANVPRIGTDRFFADYENTYKILDLWMRCSVILRIFSY